MQYSFESPVKIH